MSSDLHVVDVFDSVQGEGVQAGRPALFVRLAGCNLGTEVCPWCDTAVDGPLVKSWRRPGTRTSVSDLLPVLTRAQEQGRLIVFTGGEPLLQADALCRVISELPSGHLGVAIETNGSIWNEHVQEMLQGCIEDERVLLVTLSPKMDAGGIVHFDERWCGRGTLFDLRRRCIYREIKIPVATSGVFETFLSWVDERFDPMDLSVLGVTFQPVADPSSEVPHSSYQQLLDWHGRLPSAQSVATRWGPKFALRPQIQLLTGLR